METANDRLDAIEARLAAATPGPWVAVPNTLIGGWAVCEAGQTPGPPDFEIADFGSQPDAEFVAHARSDVEWLLEIVRAAQTVMGALCELQLRASDKGQDRVEHDELEVRE